MIRPTSTISNLRPGDVIAFGPTDWLGAVISLGTFPPWPFSLRICHLGIVAPYRGVLSLYESTADIALGPCLHAGLIVSGVQVHQLDSRLKFHLIDRRALAWRLPRRTWKIARSCLRAESVKLEEVCTSLLGTGYDAFGAWGARTLALGWLWRIVGGWLCRCRVAKTDENALLFCSEFVLLVMQSIGWLPASVRPGEYHPKGARRLLNRFRVCCEAERIVL